MKIIYSDLLLLATISFDGFLEFVKFEFLWGTPLISFVMKILNLKFIIK